MTRQSNRVKLALAVLVALSGCAAETEQQDALPNIVLIYADDLGYGDVEAYGATRVQTPAIDRLAGEGLRFTNAYSPSATCTPSRYAMLTGEYAWRRPGTGIARGDAPLIIDTDRPTLASILRGAGYITGVVGKWHLGLGPTTGAEWNGDIEPGPLEVGFDYAFLIPATGDRVPTVYVEDHRVVNLDQEDPIAVSFDGPIGDEPTGKAHPELLKMHPSHGHDQTIVNGISRIGYMQGGKTARWVDEDMADRITEKAVDFIARGKDKPFFLYFSTHDIHVPRVPHPRFEGQSGMGPRGDAIVQLDWCVSAIMAALDQHGLADNTLVLFTSDNGPVVDDGYEDHAVELLGDHDPSGGLRGGKYSAFEAGTRVPFVAWWPAKIDAGTSNALLSQVDLPATLASLVGIELPFDAAPDSYDVLPALIGDSPQGRDQLVTHAGALSLLRGDWKYVDPSNGPRYNAWVDIELGNDAEPQLYNLAEDRAESTNLAAARPDLVAELSAELEAIRSSPPLRE